MTKPYEYRMSYFAALLMDWKDKQGCLSDHIWHQYVRDNAANIIAGSYKY